MCSIEAFNIDLETDFLKAIPYEDQQAQVSMNKKQYQLGDRSTPAGSKPKEAMAALDSRGTNCSRRTTRSKRSAKTVNCPVDGKGTGAWHHAILWIA